MAHRTSSQHPVKVANWNQWEIYETIWDKDQLDAAEDVLGTVNQFLKDVFIMEEVKKYIRNLAVADYD